MMNLRRHSQERGFTLIEILVALSVFSIAALALLNIQGESAITSDALRERLFAGIVAENRLIETLVTPQAPIIGTRTGEIELASQSWMWSETISATSDSGITQINITVRRIDEETVLSDITAFRGEK